MVPLWPTFAMKVLRYATDPLPIFKRPHKSSSKHFTNSWGENKKIEHKNNMLQNKMHKKVTGQVGITSDILNALPISS